MNSENFEARLHALEMSRSVENDTRQRLRELEERFARLASADGNLAEQAEALRAGMRVLGSRADHLVASLLEIKRLAADGDVSMAARLNGIISIANGAIK